MIFCVRVLDDVKLIICEIQMTAVMSTTWDLINGQSVFREILYNVW